MIKPNFNMLHAREPLQYPFNLQSARCRRTQRVTSSQLSAHIFNANHATLSNARSNSPSSFKSASQNRFPVKRNVRNSVNGAQISATVRNEENKFRERSREVIRGHVMCISSGGSAYRMSAASNTTIANSARFLPSSQPLRPTRKKEVNVVRRLRLLLLDFIKANHLHFLPTLLQHNPFISFVRDILAPQRLKKPAFPICLFPGPNKTSRTRNSPRLVLHW